MTVEIGSRGIVQRFGGEMGQFIDGVVPNVGDMCILYPVANSDTPVCIPLTSFNTGDFVFLIPDFNFDFSIQPTLYDSMWVWDGSWVMNHGFYGSHQGYYLIKDLDDDKSGRFGVFLYPSGNGVWSSISRAITGTVSHISVQFKVGITDRPNGKFTEMQINGTTLYRKSAAESGMDTWISVNMDISPTTDPVLKIICDCPVAYNGHFTLNVANLSFS